MKRRYEYNKVTKVLGLIWNKYILNIKKKKLKKSAISHKISETNSCEIVHYGESFIAISRDVFASINKIFILARGIGTRLSFYEV